MVVPGVLCGEGLGALCSLPYQWGGLARTVADRGTAGDPSVLLDWIVIYKVTLKG